MPGEQWYIRVRGNITGPFGRAQLQDFAERALLQPHHEVSPDQRLWDPAEVHGFAVKPAPLAPIDVAGKSANDLPRCLVRRVVVDFAANSSAAA